MASALPDFNELEKEQLIRLALAIDPVQFAKALGIDPDPWQDKVLLSDSKRILLNCCRQSGKLLHIDTPIATPSGWSTKIGRAHV